MRNLLSKVCLAAMMLVMTGCEKAILEEEKSVTATDANVVLHLSVYEQYPFAAPSATRSVRDISELCSRLNVAFFQNGTKVKTMSQERSSAASFGTVSLSVAAGTYQVVIIAHSGSGTATISTTEKVTFDSNHVTDTFYYYGTLTVGSSQESYNLELKRCVAMCRFQKGDAVPDAATRIRFYYTGGSSTFSPAAGYGIVNSKQTEFFTLEPGNQQFEIYTMPHAESGTLKITVTLYNSNNDILQEKILEGVPVTVNKITTYSSALFGQGGSGNPTTPSENGIRLVADGEWGGTISY